MPQYNRILVRYRLPKPSEQWSELQWCDIKKKDEDASIEVCVAPAQDAVMPADAEFNVLPQECAKKLLVWDVDNDENNYAYCLVIKHNALFRFSFKRGTNSLAPGQYWSLESNDYDKSQPALPLKTFDQESKDDPRLAMKTQGTDNYTLLKDKEGKLPALKLRYTAWRQKVIQHREPEAGHQKKQQSKTLYAESPHKAEASKFEFAVERSPDPVRRDRLLPDDSQSISDQRLAEILQDHELSLAQYSTRQSIYTPNQEDGRSSAFFAGRNSENRSPRRPRPELKHVILAFMGAALIGFGLYMLAYTSPWIGIGVIGLAALCVCAAVLDRRPAQGEWLNPVQPLLGHR